MPNVMPLPSRKCPNCGEQHGRGEVCATHWEARLTGVEDAQSGEPIHAEEWPSGVYGHADYWLGYCTKGDKR